MNRPALLTFISTYYLLYGLARTVVSLFGLILTPITFCFSPLSLPLTIWGVIVGVLNIVLGSALLSGKDWSRPVVTVLAIFGVIAGIIAGLTGQFDLGLIVNLVVNAGVLFYMQSDDVRRFMASR